MINASREAVMQALWNLISGNQSFTGTVGDTNIVSNIPLVQMQSLYFGMPITAANVPAGASIAGFPSANSIQLSLAASGPHGGAVQSLTGQTFRTLFTRRFVVWSDVPDENKPALCWLEGDEDHQFKDGGLTIPAQITLEADAFIYTNSKISTPTSGPPPMSILNPIIDGITQSLRGNLLDGRQTLGLDGNGNPLAYHAYIEGRVRKNGGDLDGDGIAMIPLRVLVPW